MSNGRIENMSRKTVWYLKPDDEGCYLIIRHIEDWQYSKCYRVELQKDRLQQCVPYSTATICAGQVVDIWTPELCRQRGYAKRLVLLAKTTFFPKLCLSRPVTWRGRSLYQAVVKLHPDMIDLTYEQNREKYDLQLDWQKELENSF